MNSPIIDRIQSILEQRRAKGLFRQTPLPDTDIVVDLSTNSYLGLHANDRILHEAAELTGRALAGNLSSRLIGTASPLYPMLEEEIAKWKGTESSLVYNSGYAANVGILQALCSRSTEVFSDRLNHASLFDGIRLSGAKLIRYAHCDMADLQKRLAASRAQERIIVTDTVFSMDGDRAPLMDICELGQKYGCMIMVDEAHAAGVFGRKLSGLAEAEGVEDAIDIRMGTLSKAAAGLGGFFAGTSLIRDFLVNSSRSLIYSTALPHSVLAFNCAAIRFLRRNEDWGVRLLDLAERIRNECRSRGFDTMHSSTQIIPLRVGDEQTALQLSSFLRAQGIKVPAIRPPTVPPGTARIRLSVHLGLTEAHIRLLTQTLDSWRTQQIV